jgi:hypothetical protein
MIAALWVLGACNLPGSPENQEGVLPETPATQVSASSQEIITIPEFFAEEFEEGIPDGWELSEPWDITGDGTIIAKTVDQSLTLGGPLWEMTLFLRLRHTGAGGFSVRVHGAEQGAYYVVFEDGQVVVSWEGGEGSTLIEQTDLSIDKEWHDLVLMVEGGKITVVFDEEIVLKTFDADLSSMGDIGVTNTGEGALEIDHLVVAPPSVDPTAPPSTAQPLEDQSTKIEPSTDLETLDLLVDAEGELLVWLQNNGPDSLEQNRLSLTFSFESTDPELGGSVLSEDISIMIIPEGVVSFDPGITLNTSEYNYEVTLLLEPINYSDPNPANNSNTWSFQVLE